MTQWIDDFVQAGRRLWHRPALTLVATATLALGLGANIAIYTLVYAVSSQPLPVRAASELYRLGADDNCCANSGLQTRYSLFSYPLYEHLRDQVTEFSSIAGFQAAPQDTSIRPEGGAAPFSAPAEYVSGNYFSTLGVAPAAGRLLQADDDDPANPAVFVMSYRVWRDQLGADPAAIGQTFVVGGTGMTLVGVTEEPFFGETRRPSPAALFLPMGIERQVRGASSMLDREAQDWLRIIARLPNEGRVDVAQAQADTALRQWLGEHLVTTDEERAELPLTSTPIVSASAGVEEIRLAFVQPLTILFVMSGLVLLIAAANLANLMIAHTDRGQTAIRIALGAPAERLVRQALVEGLVLSLAGALVGIAVAVIVSSQIVGLVFPDAVALPLSVMPSMAVMAFAGALALVTGALFSAGPAFVMSRTDPMEALAGVGRSGQSRSFIPRRSLVVVQVALSFVLLAGAALLTSSLGALQEQPLGFEPADRVMVRLDLPATFAGDTDRLSATYRRLRDEVRLVPGVQNVTYSLYSPMESNNWSSGISIDGRVSDPDNGDGSSWNRVGPDYFDTFGTRVVRGRAIAESDTAAAPLVAVVNEAFVQRFFEDGEALGRRLGIGGVERARDLEIVGVTEDVKYTQASEPTRPMIFLSNFQMAPMVDEVARGVQARSMLLRSVAVHAPGGSGILEPLLRAAVNKADPNFTVVTVLDLNTQVAANFRMDRLMASLTASYGLLALALAALGLYAVTASAVARQTREIGIRMAMGADRGRVIRRVVRIALGQTMAGLVIGALVALFTANVIQTQLYGISARDPWLLSAAALVLVASSVLAALVPAFRASRVEPTTALRA